MTSRLILAPQESHDPHRQKVMQERAGRTADSLQKRTGVLGVMLSGSIARGPVSGSSDLDLHVIVSHEFIGYLPEWTFHEEGIIENLHTVREDELFRGWRARNKPTSLASWFHKTKLGDELHCFLPLWWNPDTKWQERLPALVSLRQNSDIAREVARYYVESAHAHIHQARNACNENAPYDSHHCLRLAFQAALTAAMVHRGWIIRGSKKRIEIAHAFLPDPLIESLLVVGFDTIGLNDMTSNLAMKICKARLRYRATFLCELRRLKAQYADDKYVASRLETTIKHQEKHNAMAYDYYSSLLAQNIILGPINHIRSFSGLPQVPRLLFSCLHRESPWPMQEFGQSDIVSQAIRDAWLEIMALTSSQKQCAHLSSRLNNALDNLISHIA